MGIRVEGCVSNRKVGMYVVGLVGAGAGWKGEGGRVVFLT